ncbi:MAG TPA: M10 family metallopeptidase C-terminal domain-containing protein [Roseiarcus sp.]
MITSAEIQTIRNADPGAILPGIDTQTGNPLPASSLINYTTITQIAKGAPYYYNAASNAVVVYQNGAVLSGINFGSASVFIEANNVTIEDCTFTATSSWTAVDQTAGHSGATVEHSTFTGSQSPTETNTWISSVQNITVEDNTFLYSPTDAVDVGAGVVTGNYFSGAGFAKGAHADAIYVSNSTGPTTITDNFIDGTYTANAAANATSDIRLTNELGNLSNVTVSGNFLLGGTYTVGVGGAAGAYPISNVSVANNYIGFYEYGEFYPDTQNFAALQGNTLVTYSDPTASAKALAAYEKTAILPAHVITATTAGQTLTSSASTPTTLIGNSLAGLIGSTNETNFLSGYGGHRMLGGEGANIFTFLSISDSTPTARDTITNFDPAKDVIDLSRIDSNITTAGLQHFAFIGTAPFSGAGAQVRYQLNPATNQTFVEADLASDAGTQTPDFEFVISGLVPLTAANFALTATQSTADMANGAALTETKIPTPTGAPTEWAYTNVQGKSYTSYEAFDVVTGGFLLLGAEDLNLSSTKDELRLYDPGLTVTRGGGAETLQVGTGAADTLSYDPTQIIDATSSGSENFVFATGFGSETIQGFAASGTTPDTIQLAISSFSYLKLGMTQAQDLAAVLAKSTENATGLRIADSHGDALTFAGLAAPVIAANPSVIKFV